MRVGYRWWLYCRSLELIRDSHSQDVMGQTQAFKLVTAACAEYLENPVIMTIKRSCTLDKALLCVMYRYNTLVNTHTGFPKFITAFEMYQRLGDLLTDIAAKQRAKDYRYQQSSRASAGASTQLGASLAVEQCDAIVLPYPPWDIFREAVERLRSQGLLRLSHSCAHPIVAVQEEATGFRLLQATALLLDVDATDIKTALKKGPFEKMISTLGAQNELR